MIAYTMEVEVVEERMVKVDYVALMLTLVKKNGNRDILIVNEVNLAKMTVGKIKERIGASGMIVNIIAKEIMTITTTMTITMTTTNTIITTTTTNTITTTPMTTQIITQL